MQRSCPLCGFSKSMTISCRMQYGLNLRTVICENCTFVYTNPVPPEEIYQRFYVEAYASYYGRIAAQPVQKLTKSMPASIKTIISKIELFGSISDKRLLEIGPGKGLFLYWANQVGCSAIGLEPSYDFYNLIRNAGLSCILGSIDNCDLHQLGKFDIVAMFHVIEHFLDPNLVLDRCRELLISDGLLVLEVPNILRPYRDLDTYFLRYVHPSNFSPATLKFLLNKHGFDVVLLEEEQYTWGSPENIFVISRKMESSISWDVVQFEHPKVIHKHLRQYRWKWRLIYAPIWYIRLWYFRLMRCIIQIAQIINGKWLNWRKSRTL